ncbi:MAG: prolipoprotein diacylglyceryl transferase [Bdellovibrionales bacterium]|nr:prolipoprotein diacylglyceryl transferase [Bdellovibrionales bacterium]
MHLKFNPLYHYIFDIAAYLSSLVIYVLQSRNKSVTLYSRSHFNRDYWRWLFAGVLIGAYLIGSFNLSLKGFFKVGHSIAGALFGGVISLEIYKLKNKIFESTGALFVLPLTIGIIIGRWGCYLQDCQMKLMGFQQIKPGCGLWRSPVEASCPAL